MSAEPSPPHHHLPAAALAELARGEGDPATLDLLLEAERSRRLLLLRMLDDAMDTGPAWDLLSEAQRRSPSVVDELLMYPQTGMWLATALRRLRGSIPQDEPPLWVVLGHFSALAAVAALRAELDFSIEVPVRHGCAAADPRLCGTAGDRAVDDGHGARRGRTRGGGDGRRHDRRTARARVGRTGVAPGAQTRGRPRRATARRGTGRPGPVSHVSAADRAAPAVRGGGDAVAAGAGAGLEGVAAGTARDGRGHAAGVFSLTPTPARERLWPRSVTSGDAFGGIEASEPDDAVQLAVTLVHEFQHTKLGGLLHLTPLLTDSADASTELWYAPWRDDPRPLDGLLQGIYAFVGIARFWRAHREEADAQKAIAHFEFALWRTHVATALEQVHRHPRRTPLGAALLDTLRGHCAQWLKEPVPEEQLALARLCAADHVARWRVHHLRPPRPRWRRPYATGWPGRADRPPPSRPSPTSSPTCPHAGWTAWPCSPATTSAPLPTNDRRPKTPRRPRPTSPEPCPVTHCWRRETPRRPSTPTGPTWPSNPSGQAPGRASGTP